jgi:hypothetical protein
MNEPFNLADINRRSTLLPAPTWIFYFNIAEMFGIFFGFLWTILCGRIIYKRPLFHTNLMRLMCSLYVGICVMEVSRFGVCVGALLDPEVLRGFYFWSFF